MGDVVTLDFTCELAIIRGDDFTYSFEFQDEACDPIDQESYTFTAPISKNGVTLGEFNINVVGSIVTLELDEIETAALAATKKASWRLRRDDNTIVGGEAEIKTL